MIYLILKRRENPRKLQKDNPPELKPLTSILKVIIEKNTKSMRNDRISKKSRSKVEAIYVISQLVETATAISNPFYMRFIE